MQPLGRRQRARQPLRLQVGIAVLVRMITQLYRTVRRVDYSTFFFIGTALTNIEIG